MHKLLLVIALSFISIGIIAQQIELEEILAKQAKFWNEGDIEQFMSYYLKSDKLQFVGANGATYGWQATLDRYKKSYPTKEKMGKLIFRVESVDRLSRKKALMVGEWTLERKTDVLNGYFMLLWKKIKGQWLIVADHSSMKCP